MSKGNERNVSSKIKKLCYILISITIFIIIAIVIKEFCKEWNFNQNIINQNNQNIQLTNIKEFSLWNQTITKLKNYKKYIELEYGDYSIKLNTDKLEKDNKVYTSVSIKNSTYSQWKNKQIVEIDLSKIEQKDLVEQVRIDTKKFLKDLSRVDLYGIKLNTQKAEFIETKEIEEENLTIITTPEYEKYILIYIPIERIEAESEYIILKNETCPLKISIYPTNATYKVIHIEDKENDIIKIEDNGIIQALQAGTEEIELQAENGQVIKKISIIVKEIAEGIEVDKASVELTEGESIKINAKVLPENIENKKLYYESLKPEIITVDENGNIKAIKEGNASVNIKTEAEPIQERQITVTVKKKIVEENIISINTNQTQTENQRSLIQQNYVKGVLLVNKQYSLPNNYNPGTNVEALQAFNNMKEVARQSGISLKIISGFRSYQTQQSIYQRNVNLYGEEVADRFSAKPGQSEHQTGLAFDINSTRWDFADTAEGKWLAANCYTYGFIIRYPENKEEITGYVYEPWHIRYVGTDISNEIKNTGLCLEEYLEV